MLLYFLVLFCTFLILFFCTFCNSYCGDEVEQVFCSGADGALTAPPNNLPKSRHHTANCREITFTVTAKQFKHPPNETLLQLLSIKLQMMVKILYNCTNQVYYTKILYNILYNCENKVYNTKILYKILYNCAKYIIQRYYTRYYTTVQTKYILQRYYTTVQTKDIGLDQSDRG